MPSQYHAGARSPWRESVTLPVMALTLMDAADWTPDLLGRFAALVRERLTVAAAALGFEEGSREQMDLGEALDELEWATESGDLDEFDVAWDAVYDWCDRESVWVEPTGDAADLALALVDA